MKKTGLTSVFILFLISVLNAQNVQWATEVIEFSSELTSIQYSAKQILGKPNVLPAGGESPNAWTPDKANSKEFVKVGFAVPVAIKQIAIGESYHPSAIINLYVYDELGVEYHVSDLSPRMVPIKGRVLNIFYETSFKVKAVKIEFDGSKVSDYYSIDAIAISDSEDLIEAVVDLPEDLNADIGTERLSENVNSEYKEYKPLLTPDGNTLIFSRKNHPENVGGVDDPEDIWYSEKGTDGEWQPAKNMGPEFNNEGPNYVSSITPDGKTVVLLLGNKYLPNGKMEAGVSMSTNDGGSWSPPLALEIENEYNYNEKANFFLANTRKVLLMSIEREDSYGDRDLYVSFLREDSTWTQPLNMGNVVNTANVEATPFLAADNQTMYFSSNGFSGYGGMDIYVTKRLDDSWTNWSEPQNMGSQINSQYEDSFFNIPANSDYAYYSRGVDEEDVDIFAVSMPLFQKPEPTIIVRGKLIDASNGNPISAKISYGRLSDGKEIGIIGTNSQTGEYEIILPVGELYGIHAEAEGYLAESQNIDLRNPSAEDDLIENVDLKMVPVEEEQTITLNNIFFDFDQATLKKESFPELDRLVDLMSKKASMEVVVSGHTDSTGPEDYNLSLSKRRADAVANYLKKNGINIERLEVKYFGESKPITDNNTIENRSKNRRVEFTIKKK